MKERKREREDWRECVRVRARAKEKEACQPNA
jgi:hypothetical protein